MRSWGTARDTGARDVMAGGRDKKGKRKRRKREGRVSENNGKKYYDNKRWKGKMKGEEESECNHHQE